MIRGYIPTSLLDWPGHVSSVIFLGKCDWGCDFCHNQHLENLPPLIFDEVMDVLSPLKEMVPRIIISGGEPTLWDEYLDTMIDELICMGYDVGIHTNGSRPVVLKRVLPGIKFVGMDIKGSEYIYDNYIPGSKFSSVVSSVDIVHSSGKQHEFRSTMYPPFVTQELIRSFLTDLDIVMKVNSIVFQQFAKRHDDDPSPVKFSLLKSMVDSCHSKTEVFYRGFDQHLAK